MKEKAMLAVRGTRAASGESLNHQNFNRESRDRGKTTARNAKPVGEETGKTRVKKSA
jgi:hypothetical protein